MSEKTQMSDPAALSDRYLADRIVEALPNDADAAELAAWIRHRAVDRRARLVDTLDGVIQYLRGGDGTPLAVLGQAMNGPKADKEDLIRDLCQVRARCRQDERRTDTPAPALSEPPEGFVAREDVPTERELDAATSAYVQHGRNLAAGVVRKLIKDPETRQGMRDALTTANGVRREAQQECQ